ncbi:MAG: metallophosphoesterase family protein [Candidatus Omnitrophota bacterium]
MKIGIISDTHSKPIPKQPLEDFKKVDFIIHAGDFCSVDVIEQLKSIKELKGVYGNMDGADIRKIFPRSQIIKCGKFSIGLFHGEGAPAGLLDVVKEEFKNKKVDVVIFGHSHRSMNERIGDVLYFNPGSPNDHVFAPCCSYGILDIDEEITGKIIKIKDAAHG